MSSPSPESVVARRGEILTTSVDSELVMLDSKQSRYYGLDPIGKRIWELLEQPLSVAALCRALEDEFDVPAETCRADVLTFLEKLSDAELVEIR